MSGHAKNAQMSQHWPVSQAELTVVQQQSKVISFKDVQQWLAWCFLP